MRAAASGAGRTIENFSAQVAVEVGAVEADQILTYFARAMDTGLEVSNVRTFQGGFDSLPPRHVLQFDVSGEQHAIDGARSGIDHLLKVFGDGLPPAAPATR